jgi:hypothetical protein
MPGFDGGRQVHQGGYAAEHAGVVNETYQLSRVGLTSEVVTPQPGWWCLVCMDKLDSAWKASIFLIAAAVHHLSWHHAFPAATIQNGISWPVTSCTCGTRTSRVGEMDIALEIGGPDVQSKRSFRIR